MYVTEISTGVIAELNKLGYAKSTMRDIARALSVIAKWFNKESGGIFTESHGERYSNLLKTQLESGKISKPWYHIKTNCLEQMRLYAAGESVRRDYEKCSHRQFQPSADANALIEAVLAEKPALTKGFKRKLGGIMRHFLCYVEGKHLPLASISRSVMIDYILSCSDYSRGQMQYVARGLTELAKYLVDHGQMERVPDFRFIIPRRPGHKLVPAFTPQEVADILNSIDRNTPVGSRNYAIILLAVTTGLRAGDIIRLKLRDIDWQSGIISIVQNKTRKPLTVPVSGQARNAVSEYILNFRPKSDAQNIFLRIRAPFNALSSSPTSMFNRAAEKAGVEKKSRRAFHSLRRSFGTWLAKARVPVTTISQLLGHVDMDADRVYLSFDDAQINECAMGFYDIPLTRRIFDDIHGTT